ncbi:MAG: hypothetical protein V4463_08510 [Pseudomonadota bacterium]
MDAPRDDYDTPWKHAVTRYFPEFMAFFFPAAHAGIDWTIPYAFLDQELAQVRRDAKVGKRVLDKLARVARNDGGAPFVFVHVEIQRGHDSDFAERIRSLN